MSSLNRVILVGRLTRDPEIKETSGGALARLGLATNETWTDKSGQRQERTEYHNITAFGKTAELCGRYLSKGRQVLIEGKLETRAYQDREGVERKSTEIKASNVTFLSGGDNQQPRQQNAPASNGWGGQPQQPQQSQQWGAPQRQTAPASNGWGNPGGGSDPIPF